MCILSLAAWCLPPRAPNTWRRLLHITIIMTMRLMVRIIRMMRMGMMRMMMTMRMMRMMIVNSNILFKYSWIFIVADLVSSNNAVASFYKDWLGNTQWVYTKCYYRHRHRHQMYFQIFSKYIPNISKCISIQMYISQLFKGFTPAAADI